MHPSSRKAFQLTRVVMRNDRLEQRARSKDSIGNPKSMFRQYAYLSLLVVDINMNFS
jgi:Translation machinery-associated protein 16